MPAAAAAQASAYWRAAGMSYLKYANMCAGLVRGLELPPPKPSRREKRHRQQEQELGQEEPHAEAQRAEPAPPPPPAAMDTDAELVEPDDGTMTEEGGAGTTDPGMIWWQSTALIKGFRLGASGG